MSRIRLIHTSVFQLLMRYAGLVCLIAVACFAIIYWITLAQLHSQIDAGLRAEVAALTRLYDLKGIAGLEQTVAALSTTKSIAASNAGDAGPRQYLLVNRAFRPLAGSLKSWPAGMTQSNPTWATLWIRLRKPQPSLDSERYRFEMRAMAVTLPGGYHLLVGQSLNEIAELRNTILFLSIAAVLVVLCAGLIGGALVGRGVVRRLQEVTRTADTIMAGDLSQRIPEARSRNEFDALAGKLNAMLARIDELMRGMRDVTENVAHDLRSPLTRLRGRAEIALMKDDDAPLQREALQKVIEETDQLVTTLNAILNIAQIESGTKREWSDVDLEAVCRDAAELYEALAEEKSVRFDVEIARAGKVKGNRQLLAQAVGNLLDNAIKYTPAGGKVTLALARHESRINIVVADSGPGIPATLREKALERFSRLDASRGAPGNGLGLALVKAVGDRHGAVLSLSDNRPGLRVILSFRPASGNS
ncbi:MAG: sensor histidine kinase [Gammaproteobacteria bacterium]